MATVTKKGLNSVVVYASVHGNSWHETYTFQTTAAGVFANSDKATAVVQTDVVRLGIIPAGIELIDCLSICSDAFTVGATHKLGFQYVDGVDSSAVPQDDDYFYAALAATVGRTPANNTASRPVVLPKDCYLILTVNAATADHAAVGIYDFVIRGHYVGV